MHLRQGACEPEIECDMLAVPISNVETFLCGTDQGYDIEIDCRGMLRIKRDGEYYLFKSIQELLRGERQAGK